MIWIFLLAILVVGATVFISSLYVVKQQSVAIIERFGRYQKISNSGIHVRAPLESIKLRRVCNCVSCKARLWSKQRHKITYLLP